MCKPCYTCLVVFSDRIMVILTNSNWNVVSQCFSMTGRGYRLGSGSRSVPLSHTHSPPMVVHSPAHPVAVSGVSQEHPLSLGLWLPASILVIVILPDLLARSWRQESPRLPSTSPSRLPPTPRIIHTSCCKVPCLLPPTILTLASTIALRLS